MRIKIVSVGKLKEKYHKNACAEYLKRLSGYCKTEIVEVKDEREDIPGAIEKEGEGILSRLNPNEYVITLEIEGKMLDSVELAKKISDLAVRGTSNIAFVIGGSGGLHENVKKRSDFRLSFSKMTFPHQLMRVILLEQIYRTFKINNNEKYHK